MLRFLLAIVVACAAQTAIAQCPGGVCPRPVRSSVAARGPSHLPRQNSDLRPIPAKHSSGHHSANRGFRRFGGKGLFPRLRFAP